MIVEMFKIISFVSLVNPKFEMIFSFGFNMERKLQFSLVEQLSSRHIPK